MARSNSVSPLQALEDEMVQAVVAETGMQPEAVRFLVGPIVRHLASEYGGDRIYIPKAREIDAEQVRRDFGESKDVTLVCRTHGISRRTLYRLLQDAA